ncbi:MAG: SDR family oxidoreductase, partial [Trichodesmium sp. St16_bin2-tuft]|nr:SDR family oxidoreductase [Trichodesmium sp. St16_bin2-tuft]
TISCLVRANNLDAGWERLKDKLKTSGLWSEDFSSRIIPIVGDLGISSFGLSASQYNNLSQEIDVIYHLGVKVHHLLSYALLKNANVLGTEEVLRMASLAKIKPVHYVSTISVFSTSQSDQPIMESSQRLWILVICLRVVMLKQNGWENSWFGKLPNVVYQ